MRHQELNDNSQAPSRIEEQSSPNIPSSDVKLQLEGGDDDGEANPDKKDGIEMEEIKIEEGHNSPVQTRDLPVEIAVADHRNPTTVLNVDPSRYQNRDVQPNANA